MTLAEAAAEYLTAGLHILALTDKRPNAQFHENWSYEESIRGAPEGEDDMAELRRIFEAPTTTGIALLIPPNMLVADIDTEEAAALYMEMAGELPDTPVSMTSNGLHAWFVSPGADQSYWLGQRTLLLKGLGGYVAAPPSKHPSGHVYTWVNPLVVDGMIRAIDWLPEKMAVVLRERAALGDFKRPDLRADEERWSIAFDDREHPLHGKLYRRWDLDGLCKAIIEAADGNQNNVILWAALTAQEEGVPYAVAMEQLLAASVTGGHPRQRARTTIKGAYARRGAAK